MSNDYYLNGMNSGANFGANFNDDLGCGDMDIDTLKLNNLGVDATFSHEEPFISLSDAYMVLPIDPSTDHTTPASTSTSSILNAPSLPKSDIVHDHRPTKRKKVNEGDATHILPEGPQLPGSQVQTRRLPTPLNIVLPIGHSADRSTSASTPTSSMSTKHGINIFAFPQSSSIFLKIT